MTDSTDRTDSTDKPQVPVMLSVELEYLLQAIANQNRLTVEEVILNALAGSIGALGALGAVVESPGRGQ